MIMLTARSTDITSSRGLDLGADDYVTKPFNPRELVARNRGPAAPCESDRLRRRTCSSASSPSVSSGMRSSCRARPSNLTPTEFRLLEALAREPWSGLFRADCRIGCSGSTTRVWERTVDVHIMNLRRKIEPDPARPRLIGTVVGSAIGSRISEMRTSGRMHREGTMRHSLRFRLLLGNVLVVSLRSVSPRSRPAARPPASSSADGGEQAIRVTGVSPACSADSMR